MDSLDADPVVEGGDHGACHVGAVGAFESGVQPDHTSRGEVVVEELPVVVERAHCDAIVLSGSIEPPPELLSASLPELVRRAGVPVFVGGQTAARYRDPIVHAGAHAVGNDLVLGLRDIDRSLNTMRP